MDDDRTFMISNDGPAVTRTGYWRTEVARAGFVYLTINDSTLRVLLPPGVELLLEALPPVGTALELSCGTSRFKPRAIYKLTWLDTFSIDIDQEQCDRPWPSIEEGRIVTLIWYTQVGEDGVCERRRELVQLGDVVAS